MQTTQVSRWLVSITLATLAACSADDASSSAEPTQPDAATTPSPTDGMTNTAQPALPTPTGTCPTLANGDVTFAPAGMAPRKVKLTFDANKASDQAPLLLYWHATGSGTFEANYALGNTQNAFVASGGIIAVPYSDDTAGQFEWFIVNQSPKLDDFLLADEIVACLHAAQRIDAKRIHSMGMSAGALQTTALSLMRSNYIASVATYSGGLPAGFTPPIQAPNNKFAALIFNGGTSDNVYGVNFKAASEAYQTSLKAAGHFAALCSHGNGHKIPLDAAPSVVTFFADNPYGAWPSPYTAGLPQGFPSYCSP